MQKSLRNWSRRLRDEIKDKNTAKKAYFQDIASGIKIGFDPSKVETGGVDPIDNEKATWTWSSIKTIDNAKGTDN